MGGRTYRGEEREWSMAERANNGWREGRRRWTRWTEGWGNREVHGEETDAGREDRREREIERESWVFTSSMCILLSNQSTV